MTGSGQTGRERARALDKFYTRPEVVDACLRHAQEAALHHGLAAPALTVEPSAGAGAFLEKITGPKIGLDLAPESPGIMRADFMGWTPPAADGPVWTLGNPPFGKNASLALRFINRAAGFSELVGFVLPRTFENPGFRSRVDRRLHLISQMALPEDAFTIAGEPARIPAVFQVWRRGGVLRTDQPRATTHADFSFVPLPQADLAVQRVGVRAGAVKDPPFTVASASHHGVRADRISAAELRERLSGLDYASVKFRTAGNPSVGKADLVELYSRMF